MKKQLFVLLAACAWISLVVLDQDGLFGIVALALPAILVAAISYCRFAGYIPGRSYLVLALAVAVCISFAFLKGYRDCCKPPGYLVLPVIHADGNVTNNQDQVQKLKTGAQVRSEVIAYCIPAILFGSVCFWWLRTSAGKRPRRFGGPTIIDAEYADLGQGPSRQLSSDSARTRKGT